MEPMSNCAGAMQLHVSVTHAKNLTRECQQLFQHLQLKDGSVPSHDWGQRKASLGCLGCVSDNNPSDDGRLTLNLRPATDSTVVATLHIPPRQTGLSRLLQDGIRIQTGAAGGKPHASSKLEAALQKAVPSKEWLDALGLPVETWCAWPKLKGAIAVLNQLPIGSQQGCRLLWSPEHPGIVLAGWTVTQDESSTLNHKQPIERKNSSSHKQPIERKNSSAKRQTLPVRLRWAALQYKAGLEGFEVVQPGLDTLSIAVHIATAATFPKLVAMQATMHPSGKHLALVCTDAAGHMCYAQLNSDGSINSQCTLPVTTPRSEPREVRSSLWLPGSSICCVLDSNGSFYAVGPDGCCLQVNLQLRSKAAAETSCTTHKPKPAQQVWQLDSLLPATNHSPSKAARKYSMCLVTPRRQPHQPDTSNHVNAQLLSSQVVSLHCLLACTDGSHVWLISAAVHAASQAQLDGIRVSSQCNPLPNSRVIEPIQPMTASRTALPPNGLGHTVGGPSSDADFDMSEFLRPARVSGVSRDVSNAGGALPQPLWHTDGVAPIDLSVSFQGLPMLDIRSTRRPSNTLMQNVADSPPINTSHSNWVQSPSTGDYRTNSDLAREASDTFLRSPSEPRESQNGIDDYLHAAGHRESGMRPSPFTGHMAQEAALYDSMTRKSSAGQGRGAGSIAAEPAGITGMNGKQGSISTKRMFTDEEELMLVQDRQFRYGLGGPLHDPILAIPATHTSVNKTQQVVSKSTGGGSLSPGKGQENGLFGGSQANSPWIQSHISQPTSLGGGLSPRAAHALGHVAANHNGSIAAPGSPDRFAAAMVLSCNPLYYTTIKQM